VADLVSNNVKAFFCKECSPLDTSPVGLMVAKVAIATAKKRFPELESTALMVSLLQGWAKQCGCILTQDQLDELAKTPVMAKKLDATKRQNCTQMSLGLD